LRIAKGHFYREKAKLLLLWAAEANNPVVTEQLRQRAEECLIEAAALDAQSSWPLPTEQAPQAMQRQQQIQPKKEDE
jgi:hypothetical protein